MVEFSKGELTQIWDTIDQGTPYRWPVGAKSAARLAAITTTAGADANRDELSAALSPLLASVEKLAVASWIIRDWGGIRRASDENIAIMVAGLDNYSDTSVDAFIAARGCQRVSSWSKLLAFRDNRKWAIYDSRTAVALNAALLTIGRAPAFEMPLSRNTKIEPRRKAIAASQDRATALGYLAYLAVLRALRDHKGVATIGDVEIVLFANAEKIVGNIGT